MPPDDAPSSDEKSVLSPEELDISDDDRVAEIDDGRYVISSDQSSPSVPNERSSPDPDDRRESSHDDPDDEREPVELSEEVVQQWLREYVSEMNSQYGFQITAKFDDSTGQQQLVSNDVVTVFENLLLWYGQQLDSQTAVEEVLGILLMEANVSVNYPAHSIKAYLAHHDLGPEDSIADLLETVDGGFAFPPPGKS